MSKQRNVILNGIIVESLKNNSSNQKTYKTWKQVGLCFNFVTIVISAHVLMRLRQPRNSQDNPLGMVVCPGLYSKVINKAWVGHFTACLYSRDYITGESGLVGPWGEIYAICTADALKLLLVVDILKPFATKLADEIHQPAVACSLALTSVF